MTEVLDETLWDDIAIPGGWHDDFFGEDPARVELGVATERAAPWNWEEARRAFHDEIHERTGIHNYPNMKIATMQAMMDRVWAKMKAEGYVLLDGGNEPRGLVVLSGTRVSDLGNPEDALPLLLQSFQSQFTTYATAAEIYTVGFKSLATCWPGRGLEWLKVGSDQAKEYTWRAVGDIYGVTVTQFFDCLGLVSERHMRPWGHTGFHPKAIALGLGDLRNKAYWRDKFTQFWLLMQTTAMTLDATNRTIHHVCMCKQGIDRSVITCLVMSAILCSFGFEVKCRNVCAWAQEKRKCQQGRTCDFCGRVGQHDGRQPYDFVVLDDHRALLGFAVEQFFDTILALEDLAPPG